MSEVASHRWTDKPLARLALWALGFVAISASGGVGWLVSAAVRNEATDIRQDVADVRQDEEIRNLREQAKQDRREILDELKEIKSDVKAMRK